MQVVKFGGTSVGSAKNIKQVVSILKHYAKTDSVACIVSAVGGITDKLLHIGKLAQDKNETYFFEFEYVKKVHLSLLSELITTPTEAVIKPLEHQLETLKSLLDGIYLINELSPKTTNKLLSFGEILSSHIITETLKYEGLEAVNKNSQDLIITNNNFIKADVNYKLTNANIKTYFKNAKQRLTILPGFISKSETGEITTLGRGGSDYTGAIVAAALNVKRLEIWTDVSGMYTANPKLVKQAYPIKKLSYQEAVELSHFGAKVLYPPTVQPVMDKNIPIHIKNTSDPEAHGTIIANKTGNETTPVKGISHIENIALLTLQGNGMVGVPGFSKRLFETLAQEKINIILITQASSEHSICFGINENDAACAKQAVDSIFESEINLHKIDPIIVENNLSIIALIGDNMKNHQGISGKMFSALGKNNINIRAIAQGASEKNISAVITKTDVKKALNALHETFFEIKTKQLNVFIIGVGNVGERLIEQIDKQQEYLKDILKINLRIIGLSNSKNMIFNENGLPLKQWKANLLNGNPASLQGFFEHVKQLNLRNSVFVDITANEDVSKQYENYLKERIAVVACNKIACSSNYKQYSALKQSARKYNAPFLFETNVGAGLPIINTLQNLIASGDKINTIQAVLSGTLNFVFNLFNDTAKFHDVVKQAQKAGYTEPNPLLDLSGVDVARKLLILIRESGVTMNLSDIKNESFLTKANLESTSVDHFYETLLADEMHFQNIYTAAKTNHHKLKYVAEFKNGKAKVGLQEIAQNHPFYNLEGKDNVVMFYTQRYPEQPMIIQGAGAGADVTASGLFADIIRLGNN